MELHYTNPGLFIVPAHRSETGKFRFGLVTFQTYKPAWLLRILSNDTMIQLVDL